MATIRGRPDAAVDRASLEDPAAGNGGQAEGRIIYLEVTNQRISGFPANRLRRRKEASDAELADMRLEVGGTALRWESLDEDISVEGVVAGRFQLPPVQD